MRKHPVGLLLVFAAIVLLAYSRWIEPIWIEVTHHRAAADIDRPLKIILLSDLHTHAFGAREKKVLEILNREQPDAILISGDTVANEGDWRSVGILLRQIRAPLGVFLVRGNWEHWRPDPNELKVYQDSGVTFLNNEARPLSGKVWVTGLDDGFAGSPDENLAFAKIPSGAFTIALFHSPAYFESIKHQVALGLAGHTHGGQIRLPFLAPFWLPPGSGDYVEGWYERGANRMYVSRGIGNSILEMRFACRPEISVFTLNSKK